MSWWIRQTHSFLFHKILIGGLEYITCGLLRCFYQLFGLWRHPFTAEEPLVSKWCEIWWRNKLIYISDGFRVKIFLANIHFWMNYCCVIIHSFSDWHILFIIFYDQTKLWILKHIHVPGNWRGKDDGNHYWSAGIMSFQSQICVKDCQTVILAWTLSDS